MTDARSIIATVRDGGVPAAGALRWFAQGLADGTVTDAQAGAFAMAVLLRGQEGGGLGAAGRVALTEAMRDSGKVLHWDLPGPVIDKHSTGGIGDSVSLLLAPALAVCGAFVPMVSGRGLGHTGGTLDKLESIPGFRTGLDETALRKQIAGLRCAIVAATADIAPADKRLYAVRDVTSTVESIDLITASILSKKLAAGLEALVLDVKVGSGAFMRDMAHAEALAAALVSTANGAGCRTAALITDMDQPLASCAGNALEVLEVMETLTGGAINARLWDLTCKLGGEALALAGMATDADEGEGMIAEALESGAAAERFGQMVAAQGGPLDFVDCYADRLPAAPVLREVRCTEEGTVAAIDGFVLGQAVVALGGGRLRDGDRINPAVGLSDMVGLGAAMHPGVPFARIHAQNEAQADRAEAAVRAAYRLGATGDPPPMVWKRVGA